MIFIIESVMTVSWQVLEEKQVHVAKILTGSLEKERVAHAYLFEGDRGTGKKDTALMLAKSLFCKQKEGVEPCGHCGDCRRIDSGNHPDVHVVVPEGSSIKKHQIAGLIREFSYKGLESRQKAFIVEHADQMTIQAANGLLKFLEEPRGMTVAILLSELAGKMLPTVISRCQVLSFVPLGREALEQQMISFGGTETTRKIIAFLTNDLKASESLCRDEWFARAQAIVVQLTKKLEMSVHQIFLFLENEWIPHFQEKVQYELGLELLLLWFRDVLFVALEKSEFTVYKDDAQSVATAASRLTEADIVNRMTDIFEARRRLNANVSPQSVMEQLVLKFQEGSRHV